MKIVIILLLVVTMQSVRCFLPLPTNLLQLALVSQLLQNPFNGLTGLTDTTQLFGNVQNIVDLLKLLDSPPFNAINTVPNPLTFLPLHSIAGNLPLQLLTSSLGGVTGGVFDGIITPLTTLAKMIGVKPEALDSILKTLKLTAPMVFGLVNGLQGSALDALKGDKLLPGLQALLNKALDDLKNSQLLKNVPNSVINSEELLKAVLGRKLSLDQFLDICTKLGIDNAKLIQLFNDVSQSYTNLVAQILKDATAKGITVSVGVN